MAKYIESVTTELVELDIIECQCGFHLGLDSSFLDQVDEIEIVCPSCNHLIKTAEIETLLMNSDDVSD